MTGRAETRTLDAATYEAVRRALNHVDATDPCPLCESWPEHEDSCVMAASELDGILGRGLLPHSRSAPRP